ncbi:MAG: pantoate--beta-alanine ligase [Flavitalea sp.]
MLLIIKTVAELSKYLDKKLPAKIGFVPTMGALHEGHLTLVRQSKEENDQTVASIFINPTQFNDPKDFAKYPKTIEQDIEKLESAGCDILYLPEVEDLYPGGIRELEAFDLGNLENVFEGKFRPGHFQGVCLVMKRLLMAVQPHDLYMGQKDYQQCMVVRELIRLEDLSVILHTVPTIRESSGLAMSSRNLRLNPENREKAAAIYRELKSMSEDLVPGNLQSTTAKAQQNLETLGFTIDYFEFADADTLEPVSIWDGKQKLVALAAVFLQDVRLIDNLLVGSN